MAPASTGGGIIKLFVAATARARTENEGSPDGNGRLASRPEIVFLLSVFSGDRLSG